MTARMITLMTGIVALALAATACSGANHPTGVATLAGAHTTTTVKKSKEAAKQEMQDAALAFARCMREHGVDMPDPTFDSGGGGFAIRQQGPAARPNDATTQAAQQACQPIMDKAQQDMPQPSPAEQAKMRDQALKFARCMRAHGIDMPDPTFDANGGAKIQMRASSGPGADTGNGGSVTNGNGANPPPPGDDAKMQAAAKACGGPGGGLFTTKGAP